MNKIISELSLKKKMLYGLLVVCIIGGIVAAIVLTRSSKSSVGQTWSCLMIGNTPVCQPQNSGDGKYSSKEICETNCHVECPCKGPVACGNATCCNGTTVEYTWESPEYFNSQFTSVVGESTEFVSQQLSKYMIPNFYFKWAKNVKYDCGKGNILSFHNNNSGGGFCNGTHTTCGCCPYDNPIYMGNDKCCPNGTTSISENKCILGYSELKYNPTSSSQPTKNTNWKGNIIHIDSLDDNVDSTCNGLCSSLENENSSCIQVGNRCVSRCEYPPTTDYLPISLSTQTLTKKNAVLAYNQAVPCDLDIGNISSSNLMESRFAMWSQSVNNKKITPSTHHSWVCDGLQIGQYLKDNTGKLWICEEFVYSGGFKAPIPVTDIGDNTQITLDKLITGNVYKAVDGNVQPCLQYLQNKTNPSSTDACNVSYTATDNLLQLQMLNDNSINLQDLKDISAKHRYNANVSETICGNSSGCKWVPFIDGIGNTNGICVTK